MSHFFSNNPGARGNGQEQETRTIPDIEIIYRYVRRTFPMMQKADIEDIAHDAWIIATKRGYWHPRMIREAARSAGMWDENDSLDDLIENGRDFAAKTEPSIDERLEILRDDPRFREAIEAILQGVNITKTVASYSKFIREARQAYLQPSLF